MTAVLERIDDIDWARLSHAYGPADDVPDQIRALRSDERDVRRKALHQLYGNIYHQGTRYEATAHAVPFLLEVLAARDTADRAEVLGLLTAITVGYDEYYLPDSVPIADHRRQAVGGDVLLAAQPRSDDEDDDGEATYEYLESLSEDDQNRFHAFVAVAAYDAVRAGVPLFRTLLAEDDDELRIAAAYALAWFPEDADGSVPALAGVAERFPGPESAAAVATALVAIGLLGGDVPAAALADARPSVRWAAAIAQAQTLRSDVPQAAVTELLTWAGGTTEADERIPFLGGDLAGYAGLAMQQAGPRHTDAAFSALLARIPSVSAMEALSVVAAALRQAFPAGPPTPDTSFPDLTEPQRRLLQTLADSPGTWLLNGWPFGNFRLLIGSYQLPADCDTMRAYTATD